MRVRTAEGRQPHAPDHRSPQRTASRHRWDPAGKESADHLRLYWSSETQSELGAGSVRSRLGLSRRRAIEANNPPVSRFAPRRNGQAV